MKEYRRNEWKEFRLEVIERDGGICSVCKKSEQDGVVLQVHHTQYISGKKPWEYSYDLCETLCKGCHAAEHGIIPPKTGWTYIFHNDLGDLCGTCEYCGSSLRHVFFIHHKKWGTMEVGTICCDNLTATELASNVMESQQHYQARLKRFCNSVRWKLTENNTFEIKQKQMQVEIFIHENMYKIKMNSISGKMLFSSIEEAKTRIFNIIETGEAEAYFQRKKIN